MPAPALVVPAPAADEPDFHDAREEQEEPLDADLALAEDLLHEGSLADAEGFAWRALRCASATPGDVTRAFCVLLQCDFEARRLTDLEAACASCGRALEAVPVTVPLLWGVIALELGESAAARAPLLRYCGTAAVAAASSSSSSSSSSISRADALALARLLAVRVLASAERDALAARAWLADDARRPSPLLSPEQRRLLLVEVDEAEEEARLEDEALAAAEVAEEAPSAAPGAALAALLKSTVAATGATTTTTGAPPASTAAPAVEVTAGSDFMTMTGEMMGPAVAEFDDTAGLADAPPASFWGGGNGGRGSAGSNGGGGGGNGGNDQSSKYAQRQPQPAQQQQQPECPYPGRSSGATTAPEAAAAPPPPRARGAATPPPGNTTSSWRQWASGALSALNLEDADPAHVAVGAAGAALVAYSLWRERKAVRAAARRVGVAAASALAQTAGMAFGFSPSPMAAAPRAQYGP